MKRIALPFLALAAVVTISMGASSKPYTGPLPATSPALHCQVPCGIYGDSMRIEMLAEDAATIEKAMTTLDAMDKQNAPSTNQMVRWVMTKDQHAQSIQDTIASYWLAQRIKAPKDGESKDKYHNQLELLHGITVAAMKCKQTTDMAHVASLRSLAHAFAQTYFSKEDLEHMHGEHEGEHK